MYRKPWLFTYLFIFCIILSLTFFKMTQANTSSSPSVSVLSHLGGASYSVAVDGTYAYIGEGPRITSINVSNPENPLHIASSTILSDTVQGITLSGTYAYIAANTGGLFIADISNPASLSILGHYDSPGTATDVKVRGNYAYLADQSSLKIIRISDPTNPVEITTININATSLTFSDNLLYVVGGKYLRILDISNPLNILTLGYYDVSPQTIGGVEVIGSHAYLAVRDGLQILDISDPPSIQSIATYYVSSTRNIAVVEPYAYLASDGGMTLIDLSNPAHPQQIGFYTTMDDVFDIQVGTSYAYLADSDGGLRLVDINNPEIPVEVGFYSTLGDIRKIVATDEFLYLVNSGSAWSEFWVIDIAIPQTPQRIGYTQIPPSFGEMTISGRYIYTILANSVGSVVDILILDVDNPSSPNEVGRLSIETADISDVAVVGSFLYVLEYYKGIRIYDITDPVHPAYQGFYSITDNPYLYNIEISGNYAYVADGHSGNGLHILDISDPAVPWQVYTLFLTRDYSSATAISGNYAYVKNGDYFSVVDVTDPTSPIALTHSREYMTPLASELRGYAVCYSCEYTNSSTLKVFEGSSILTSFNFKYHGTRAADAKGDFVYMAGSGGLFIIQVGSSSTPTLPNAPSNLNATNVSANQINLNWTDNSNNEVGFKIERSLTGSSNWMQVGMVGGSVSGYQDNSLNCDTTYYYRVQAYNNGGNSEYSSVSSATTSVCLPPAAPSLSAVSNTDGNGEYTVEWTAVNGTTSYTLQEQLNSGNWLTIYTGSATNRNLSGHADGTWCYRVQASNSGGNSSWSDKQCTTVAATSSDSWTFMLYFAGDTGSIDNGNVHAALVRAIQRLEQNPNPHVNLVVLLDGPATLDSFRITFSPQANYQPLGEKRMDDPATLVQFVQQAQTDFPADHYYLAIADHANGVQGIAWDTTTNSNRSALLKPSEIRQALATITSNGSQPIDIIHFDGCSFGLLENAVIAQDYAQYMVASQNIGWSVFAYDDYRNAVSNDSLPADLAVAIAQRYMERVSQQQYPYTISVLDLNQLSSTLSALDAFSVALTDFALVNQSNRSILANIRNQSQKFDSGGEIYLTINDEDSYIDLVDFATRTKLQLTGYNIPTTANNLIEAVTGNQPLVIYESHRSGSFDYFGSAISWNLDGAHGISLYYPKRAAGAMYGDYTSGATFPNFYSQVSWHTYLQAGVPPLAPGEPLPDDQPSPLAPLDPLIHHTFLPTIVR